MAKLRVQFTIRELMLVVAISALSLGGGFPVALLVIQAVRLRQSRRRVEKLAGEVRLRVVLPSPRRIFKAGIVSYTVFLAWSLRGLILIVIPSSFIMPLWGFLWIICAYASVGLCYWPWLSWTRLEFRQHGVVHGPHFWPWESIWMWGWMDHAEGFWLKVPDRFDEYAIAGSDVDATRAMLRECLGTVKQRPAGFVEPVAIRGQ